MSQFKVYETIQFEGKEVLLKFDYNAVADIEERFDKGISAIFDEEQIGFRTLRIFYTYGLRETVKGINERRVGNELGRMMKEEGKDLADLLEPIMNALKKSGVLGSGDSSEDGEKQDPNN
jgi:hypothetical protein